MANKLNWALAALAIATGAALLVPHDKSLGQDASLNDSAEDATAPSGDDADGLFEDSFDDAADGDDASTDDTLQPDSVAREEMVEEEVNETGVRRGIGGPRRGGYGGGGYSGRGGYGGDGFGEYGDADGDDGGYGGGGGYGGVQGGFGGGGYGGSGGGYGDEGGYGGSYGNYYASEEGSAATPEHATRTRNNLRAMEREYQQSTDAIVAEYQRTEDPAERKEMLGTLLRVVQKHFDVRQSLREDELRQLEARVRRLRKLHARRQSAKDEITRNRVEQLKRQADGMGWGVSTGEAHLTLPGAGFAPTHADFTRALPHDANWRPLRPNGTGMPLDETRPGIGRAEGNQDDDLFDASGGPTDDDDFSSADAQPDEDPFGGFDDLHSTDDQPDDEPFDGF